MAQAPAKSGIVIIGAGQHGRIARNILVAAGARILGHLDNDATKGHVVGPVTAWQRWHAEGASFHVGIGDNAARAVVFAELAVGGARFVNAIHARACVEEDAVLGRNVMIGALTYVNIGCRIGDNVILNNGVIVEHDAVIANHVHLAPGAVLAGEVTIGEGAFVGAGAIVRDRLTIPPGVVIGAGSNVVSSLDTPRGVYYGNPARFVRKV